MNPDIRPIALTCGDPAGIGPEIAVKAHAALAGRLSFFWMGDPRHLPLGSRWQSIDRPADAASVPVGTLAVLPHPFPSAARAGAPDSTHATAIVEVIARAVRLVMADEASALCTAPISKQVLRDGAGFAFPGHTEYLAALAGVDRVVMMLACRELRVVPVTIHIPLAEVPSTLTPGLLETTLRITHAALLRDFGVRAPRIAVAGLNPHAGEGGMIGREEIDIIIPVLDRLRADGMTLIGPLSADTLFHPAARSGYDAAVAMYHDQALIPIKTIDFSGGVNVTLGLPFVRTSPDHGTAFDIAGKNSADPASLIAALELAADMAHRRH